ncbi:MAG: prepilin-type N-terminal cleavage/methylation domain-containing protein [Myxococcota bacterium]|jgi:prepilin-type N-terminal cleavage/methylation domain-containing protein
MISRQHTRAAGFTLIEITAVVILISLLMSMAVVRLDSALPSTRNESMARELIANLDFARMQAIGRGQSYALVLDFEEQRFGIQLPFDDQGKLIANDEDKPILRWHKVSDGVMLRSILDPRGVRIREGKYSIPFDAQGAARDVYIYLGAEQNTDYELTIRILGLTGIASVAQGTLEPTIYVERDF